MRKIANELAKSTIHDHRTGAVNLASLFVAVLGFQQVHRYIYAELLWRRRSSPGSARMSTASSLLGSVTELVMYGFVSATKSGFCCAPRYVGVGAQDCAGQV